MSRTAFPSYTCDYLGVRRLSGVISGAYGHTVLGGLGTAPQQSTIDDLESMGYPAEWINLLLGLNATDEQLGSLEGTDPVASQQAAAQQVVSLANSLYVASGLPGATPIPIDLAQAAGGSTSISPTGTQTPASTTVPPAFTASPAQLPPGTTYVYTVSWSIALGNLSVSNSDVISALQSALPKYGMSVVSGGMAALTSYSVQLVISDQVGHQLTSDAQSVLESLVRSVVGNNLSGSSITPYAGGSSSVSSLLTSLFTSGATAASVAGAGVGEAVAAGVAVLVGIVVLRDVL